MLGHLLHTVQDLYIPGLGHLLRRTWLPDDSHEAIHLDSPSRGIYFDWAVAMARQRTLYEYARAFTAIRMNGGVEAVDRFHGTAGLRGEILPVRA